MKRAGGIQLVHGALFRSLDPRLRWLALGCHHVPAPRATAAETPLPSGFGRPCRRPGRHLHPVSLPCPENEGSELWYSANIKQ